MFRPDSRRLVVIKLQGDEEGQPLFHAYVQGALPKMHPRTEFSLEALNAIIALQELEPLLQRANVERWPDIQSQSPAQVALAEPAFSLQRHVGQGALNDLQRDHPLTDSLIGQN